MDNREKARDTLAKLGSENVELQRNLANVRNAEAEIMGRLNQNIGAQKALRQIFPEIGEPEEAAEGEPAEAGAEGEDKAGEDGKPAEAENSPEDTEPKKVPEPG